MSKDFEFMISTFGYLSVLANAILLLYHFSEGYAIE